MPDAHNLCCAFPNEGQLPAFNIVEDIKCLLGRLFVRLLALPDAHAKAYSDTISLERMQEAIEEAVEIRRVYHKQSSLPDEVLNKISHLNRSITQLREETERCCVNRPGEAAFVLQSIERTPTVEPENNDTAKHGSMEPCELQRLLSDMANQLLETLEQIPNPR